MPRFEPDPQARGPVVEGFVGDGFRVEGSVYKSLLLTPDRVLDWDPPALDGLAPTDLGPLLAIDPQPEFLILGTGAAMAFPPRALMEALEKRGMGVEAMDSRAAARTWGMLRGEDRWIVAALMPL